MKKIVIAFIQLLITATCIYAETLNVITDSESAVIKLNQQIIGTSVVTNYDIKTGTYLITVEDQGTEIYSEIIDITPDKQVHTLSIKVTNKLASEIIDSSKQKQFAKYALSKKGKLGLGLYLSPSSLSGLKFSYDLPHLSLQTIFWMFESSENKSLVTGLRAIHYFNNQFTKHTLIRLYTGAGYLYGNINNTKQMHYEIPFGAEFKLRQALPKAPIWSYLIFSYLAVGYNVLAALDGMFYFVETGLTVSDSQDDAQDYKGLKLALGLKYYF